MTPRTPSLLRETDEDRGFGPDGAPTAGARETTVTYCLHCDWEVIAAAGTSTHERSKRAVEHHLATGHTIDSIL